MCTAAAHFFTIACNKNIARHGKFMIALSGGNTPRGMYELLATPEFSRNINWKKVFIFFSDERYVPHEDQESNFKMASEALLKHVPIPKKNIFAIPTSFTPEKDAARYEKTLVKITGNKKPSLHLVLLGMGVDGHTASLFPNNEILTEKKRLVKEVFEKDKGHRISFTLPLINNAKQILVLVAGKDKAEVLKIVAANKKSDNPLPIQLIKGNITWMVA
ncbi:MAG TPA: 6-phosphogluconolactonase [Ferruginibacter sp.]|jgi:6-phosphogluconolactonase|nr:6-phosphogluconolactonase [Ferruginibacter sp.]